MFSTFYIIPNLGTRVPSPLKKTYLGLSVIKVETCSIRVTVLMSGDGNIVFSLYLFMYLFVPTKGCFKPNICVQRPT